LPAPIAPAAHPASSALPVVTAAAVAVQPGSTPEHGAVLPPQQCSGEQQGGHIRVGEQQGGHISADATLAPLAASTTPVVPLVIPDRCVREGGHIQHGIMHESTQTIAVLLHLLLS
jgi:hypothetical protein